MNQEHREHTKQVLEEVEKKMFDMQGVIRLCLVALYANGHVLLEGNPGFGKTSLVKTLGEILHFQWGRIQFTPDLMPADITGTEMPDPNDPNHDWKFRHGPIFRQLLLADEINRATPKTQSAMLEAMAEQQVTRPGTGEPEWLPIPFMVLATQNPIDQEGTYNLPEAQADRFMFKILMPVPGQEGLKKILEKATDSKSKISEQNKSGKTDPTPREREEAKERFISIHDEIRDIELRNPVRQHINNLYLATNQKYGELARDLQTTGQLEPLVRLLSYGLGPRAPIFLRLAVKGWVGLFGANPTLTQGVIYDANIAFPKIVLPVLRHRIRLEFGWETHYAKYWEEQRKRDKTRGEFPETLTEPQLREYFMMDLCLATAPRTSEGQPMLDYYKLLQKDLIAEMPKERT